MSSETEHAAPVAGAHALPAGAEQQAELLLHLATRISSTLDVQEVLDESLAAMRRLVAFGGGAIQLIENGALVAAATDPPMSPEARTVRIPVGEGVSGRIAATGEPSYIPDVPNDPRVHPEGRKKGLSSGVRSYFGVPLIAQGAPIGVLQIDAPEVDAFGSSTRTLVLAFTPTIAAAVQNAWLFEQEHEAMRRLREADRLKEDFVSIVSHELRTPLTTMQGFAELLAERADELSREQSVQLAERIVRAGRRLERLISDLLYVSRIEQGFVPIELEPTSVAAVVHAVGRELGNLPHPLEADVPDALPLVLADPDRLHQVVLNLVGNAVKFSDPHEAVRVVARDHGQHVELAVEDRGRGIPPDARGSIFELFYQAEDADTRSAGGLGIGLYVVKRLCDAMAVPIEVDDAPAGGTRIALRLKVAAT